VVDAYSDNKCGFLQSKVTESIHNKQMFHFQKNIKHCSNCGIPGHGYRDCGSPITSFGTLIFRINSQEWSQEKVLTSTPQSITGFEGFLSSVEVLLIQRRDSLGYVDLLRGKYSIHDVDYIKKQISGMTDYEREKIVSKDFEELWSEMWGAESTDIQYKKDKENSKNKLMALRDGITLDVSGTRATLADFVSQATVHWDTPEWGFPKGRRDGAETDLECALREMNEETGLNPTDVFVVHNIEPLNETFMGSNRVHYSHKYFIIYVPDGSQVRYDPQNLHMKREIGNVAWFPLQEALQKLRSENLEKREVLIKLTGLLRNYCPILHPS
jgi:8-oxo-dGTP pyrophosphatase MutT (NUDIX family)